MNRVRLVVVAALVLSLVVGVTPAMSAAKYVARFAHTQLGEDIYNMGSLKFKELVEKRSNGQIEIRIFGGGQLGADRDIQEGVQLGTIEMGLSSTPVVLLDKWFGILDLPYLFRDREHVAKVLDGPIGRKLSDRLLPLGIRHLGYWENGFRQITNSVRPIVKPEDLKGIKIRTPESPLRVKTFKAYGANPAPMPFSELFSALQQKIMDGQENPISHVYNSSFYEVQKYLSLTNHIYSPVHLLCNDAWFKKLPADLQKILIQAGLEAAEYTRELGEKHDQELISKLEAKGMKVNKADIIAFQKASKPIWADVTRDLGPGAEEMVEAIVNTK